MMKVSVLAGLFPGWPGLGMVPFIQPDEEGSPAGMRCLISSSVARNWWRCTPASGLSSFSQIMILPDLPAGCLWLHKTQDHEKGDGIAADKNCIDRRIEIAFGFRIEGIAFRICSAVRLRKFALSRPGLCGRLLPKMYRQFSILLWPLTAVIEAKPLQ